MNAPASAPVVELFAGIDDLIRRVADTENPEIRKVRAKVYAALVIAKGAVESSAGQAPRPAVQVVDTANDILRDDAPPGQAIGFALLVGLGVGLVVSLRQ